MKRIFKRLFHPLITFISIQILWIFLLVSWIYWFLGRHQQFKELATRYQAEWLPDKTDWLILTEGIVLLVAILIGIYVIFLFWKRQASLYKAQRHFINQVSHELKSPLASLQLHLETIQMRQPNPEQLQRFTSLMQEDTQRLGTLINNLLTAGRIEHKSTRLQLEECNLSQLLESYLTLEMNNFPAEGSLTWDLEGDLYARLEKDALETVLRNLLENAILYADTAPVVQVSLTRSGDNATLQISDQGPGIPPKDRKKVFRMFYRLRQTGKTIKGSGLGLFIVRNLIKLHGGKVWIGGTKGNRGTTFNLLIPLITDRKK